VLLQITEELLLLIKSADVVLDGNLPFLHGTEDVGLDIFLFAPRVLLLLLLFGLLGLLLFLFLLATRLARLGLCLTVLRLSRALVCCVLSLGCLLLIFFFDVLIIRLFSTALIVFLIVFLFILVIIVVFL